MPNPRFLKTAERWKNPSLPVKKNQSMLHIQNTS